MHEVTVVFDLDGTLADTSPDLAGALQAVLTGLGLPRVDEAFARPLAGRGARVMIEMALRELGQTVPGPEEMERLIAEFIDYYRAHIAVGSRPFPGCEAELTRLTARGARLAVCTNKREELALLLLNRLGLTHHFQAILGGDSLAVCKPDPAHVLGTIAAAGGSPSRAVMVGDSITDVTAAQRAGLPVIAVSFGFSEVPAAALGADLVIHHFAQLPGALEKVLRGA
jgi:phosphoglycolate phosphatase